MTPDTIDTKRTGADPEPIYPVLMASVERNLGVPEDVRRLTTRGTDAPVS